MTKNAFNAYLGAMFLIFSAKLGNFFGFYVYARINNVGKLLVPA